MFVQHREGHILVPFRRLVGPATSRPRTLSDPIDVN